MSGDLIDTTEMYLRTIYELLEEGVPPLRARIAERLHQSGPTVSQTVARMERDHLLVVAPDRTIKLTRRGAKLARDVMRKHRLAECLLTTVIGLEWDRVHDEACRWEHVISLDVEKRLVSILAEPTISPYGNPIPGLRDLGVESEDVSFRHGAVPLLPQVGTTARTFVLMRMSESLQAHYETLTALTEMGLRPGGEFEAVLEGGVVTISTAEGKLALEAADAELLFVGNHA